MAVDVHSDVPDRFRVGFEVSALGKDGRRTQLRIEDLWPHKGQLVLKFQGIATISEAEVLLGAELQVPQSQRGQLEPGWNYVSDLMGCKVFDGSREIGEVADVNFGAGEAPLLDVRSGARIFEIPYAEAYLVKVDLGGKRIEMRLPEGMLELDAPLSEEEKNRGLHG